MKHHDLSFEATDSEGRKYVIHQFVETRDERPADDFMATIKVLKTYVTQCGREVKRINDEEFKFVDTGAALRTVPETRS